MVRMPNFTDRRIGSFPGRVSVSSASYSAGVPLSQVDQSRGERTVRVWSTTEAPAAARRAGWTGLQRHHRPATQCVPQGRRPAGRRRSRKAIEWRRLRLRIAGERMCESTADLVPNLVCRISSTASRCRWMDVSLNERHPHAVSTLSMFSSPKKIRFALSAWAVVLYQAEDN